MRSRTLACLLLLASCSGEPPETSEDSGEAPPASETSPPDHSPDLTAAATDIVGFLRGEVPFARIRLADTVTLHLGIEEGRSRRAVPREVLRRPSNWSVRSPGLKFTYSFVPHPRLTDLTTRVGRHVRCMDYPLSATFPDLATLPHVGATLGPPEDFQSCLQTWNLTLVFDSAATPPVLVAAVYDQWEW